MTLVVPLQQLVRRWLVRVPGHARFESSQVALPIRTRLKSQLMAAMKSKDAATASVVRSVLAEVTVADKASSSGQEVDESAVIKVVKKAIRAREEAVGLFKAGDRPDLVAKEQFEVDFLQTLLPQQLSQEEVDTYVLRVIQEIKPSGKLLIGPVVGKVMKEVPPGSVDPQLINRRVKTLIEDEIASGKEGS